MTLETETLFKSGQAALNFAYRHSHGQYPANALGLAQKRGPAGPRAPRGQDAALVAGWVRQVIEGGNGLPGLPEPHRSVMLAKYSVDSQLNLTAKLRVLADVLALAMGTGLHKRRMVDLCVQRYFGGTMVCADGERRPIRQHQVADWCDVSQQTVSAAYVRIKAWLGAKEREAMDMVDGQLQQKGMIQ